MKKIFLLPLVVVFSAMLHGQNVGIGTATPAFRLDVQGRMRVKTGTLGNVNTSSGIWFEDYRNGNNQFFFGMKDSIRGGFYGSGIGWNLLFNTKTGQFSGGFLLNGPIDLYSGTSGYHGGTVYSDSNDVYINARKAGSGSYKGNLVLQFTDPRNPSLQAGNLGIGIDTPYYKLSLNGDMGIYDGPDYIGFIGNSGNRLAMNAKTGNAFFGTTPEDLVFQSDDTPLVTTGKVGIGTSTPAEKLDVNGNMKVNGEISINGSLKNNALGGANMIPVCYGVVGADGAVLGGTGNFTAVKQTTGIYSVDITGIGINLDNAAVLLTPIGFGVHRSVVLGTRPGYDFEAVWTNDVSGSAVDTKFHFVVYKP